MKKIMVLAVLVLCPAALLAQQPALEQLGRAASVKAADLAPLAIPGLNAPAQDKRALLLLDPRTGKVEVVIPAGGGFIHAATGKFTAAVFNGSGYILPDGQYLPVVGGRRAPARDFGPVKNSGGLSGRWLGWGEWTYQGSGTRCDMMTLTFEDSAKALDRKGGYFDCGFVALESLPARFAKRGTELLDETGAVAGSYAGNVITLSEAYSETVDIFTTIKVDGLHFDYLETWKDKGGKEIYVITGRLFTGSHDLP